MPNFTLELLIDSVDLRIIRAAQERILLAKPSAGSNPAVTWLAVDPFEANVVTWIPEYSIYASSNGVEGGAAILKSSETRPKAIPGRYYDFDSGATFQGPFVGNVPSESYQVRNNMPAASYPELTFGLAQRANVNGRDTDVNPIHAVSVLSRRTATFTPYDVVRVWLQANILGGTVVTEITSNYTELSYSGGIDTFVLKYDPNTGTFEQSPTAELADRSAIAVIRPAERLFLPS
jgi:hypothetical protein